MMSCSKTILMSVSSCCQCNREITSAYMLVVLAYSV